MKRKIALMFSGTLFAMVFAKFIAFAVNFFLSIPFFIAFGFCMYVTLKEVELQKSSKEAEP